MDYHTLIVTAHPDDETIFFGGLLISRPKSSTHVICVTNGDADGMGQKRQSNFESALRSLEVSGEMLDFPDVYDSRLDTEKLVSTLNQYKAKEVFTHNIIGEYGHPHHQDISFATHKSFRERAEVYSTAYNNFPSIRLELTKAIWQRKQEVLASEYWSETSRFLQYIPCTWTEGFSQVSFNEVETVYQALANHGPVKKESLKAFSHLQRYIDLWAAKQSKRPF